MQNAGIVPVPIPFIISMEMAKGGHCGFNRNMCRYFKGTVAVFKKHHSPTMYIDFPIAQRIWYFLRNRLVAFFFFSPIALFL